MECAICLEKYDAKVKRPMMIDCGHTFCKICVKKIKLASNRCPYDAIIIEKQFEKGTFPCSILDARLFKWHLNTGQNCLVFKAPSE